MPYKEIIAVCSDIHIKHTHIYRVIHENRAITGKVPVSVVERNTVRMNMCLILNCYRHGAVWGFICGGWVNSEVCEGDQLTSSILDAAACTNIREDQPRRTAGDIHTAVAKCTEVDGGDFWNIYCEL